MMTSPISYEQYDAVFISDLHLHPDMPEISKRFNTFIQWAAQSTRTLYILGDFFHVWPGDEALDSWSEGVADQLAWLHNQGVLIYFMPGNRDFLLGQRFFELAHVVPLAEPSVIRLGDLSVLLVHGDRYCTRDIAHQWLRRLTRNKCFQSLFLSLSYKTRSKLVNRVREHSQHNRQKTYKKMAVVESAVYRHVKKQGVNHLIHGHVHQPGVTEQPHYKRYVLSDWDAAPTVMCYNKSKGIFMSQLGVFDEA